MKSFANLFALAFVTFAFATGCYQTGAGARHASSEEAAAVRASATYYEESEGVVGAFNPRCAGQPNSLSIENRSWNMAKKVKLNGSDVELYKANGDDVLVLGPRQSAHFCRDYLGMVTVEATNLVGNREDDVEFADGDFDTTTVWQIANTLDTYSEDLRRPKDGGRRIWIDDNHIGRGR